ncbi:UNVERIFIED_CONTAM: hypothetical protein RMT77_001551 [Armadillidium vulgare]
MSIIQLGKRKCNNSNQQNLFVLCSKKRKNMSEDVDDINGSHKKRNIFKDKTLSVGYQHQKLAKTFGLRNKNGKKFQGDRTFREPEYTTVNITNKNVLKKKKKCKNVNKPINCAKRKLDFAETDSLNREKSHRVINATDAPIKSVLKKKKRKLDKNLNDQNISHKKEENSINRDKREDKMNASDVPMNFIFKKKRKLNKNLNHYSTSINQENSIKRTKSDNVMNASEVLMNSPLQKRKNLNKYLNDQHHSHKKQENSINKINSDSVTNTSEVPINSGLKKKKKVNKNFNDQNNSYNETHLSVLSSAPKKKKKIFSETNQAGKSQPSSLFKNLQLSTVRNSGRTSEYSRENEHEQYIINKNAENLTPSSIGKIWKSENCNEFHEEEAKFSKFDLKKSFVKGKNTIHLNSNTSEVNKFKVRKCEGIEEKDTIKKKGNQFITSKHFESRVASNQKRRENYQVFDERGGSNCKLQSDIGIRKQNLISKQKNDLSLESQPEKIDEELATNHISKLNKLSSSNSAESLKSLNKIYKRKKHETTVNDEEKKGSDINYSETFGSKTNKINCVNIKSSKKRKNCIKKQSNNENLMEGLSKANLNKEIKKEKETSVISPTYASHDICKHKIKNKEQEENPLMSKIIKHSSRNLFKNVSILKTIEEKVCFKDCCSQSSTSFAPVKRYKPSLHVNDFKSNQDDIKSFTTTRSLGYQSCNSDSASEMKLEEDTLNSEDPQ